MTLVAGFNCRDGLLLCADMEQVTGASSRRVSKLAMRCTTGSWCYSITGAGSGAVIDNCVDKIWDAMKSEPDYNEEKMEDVLTEVLTKAHTKYVWPDKRNDHSISLIVAYTDMQSFRQKLWITYDLVPMPEVKHVCAGIGEDLANYLADQLWHPFYSEQQAVRMAAFIFKEVKEHVGNVGQGTEMWMLQKGGKTKFYNRHETALLESGLPSFERNIYDFGKEIIGPLFPILPFTLSVPNKEICTEDKNVFQGPKGIGAKDLGKLTFK